jgi:Zn-dependent protease
MGEEGPPKTNVVDLRRWREERDRRLRAAGKPAAEPSRSIEVESHPAPRKGTSGLSRVLRPLPLFLGISVLVLLPGIGIDLWEPALFWFVGFLHISLHELGHFLAVRRVGYTPRLVVVGPLTIRWEEGGRRAEATRDWRWLFGGHVWFDALPPRRSRARDLAVLVAGPVANLLTLGTVLAVHPFLAPNPLFALYVRANLLCAALVLLANLLPLPRTPEGYATDGRQILEILRGRRIA